MELQQRRFAGAKVDIPCSPPAAPGSPGGPGAPGLPSLHSAPGSSGLTPMQSSGILAPSAVPHANGGGGRASGVYGNGTGAHDQAQAHTLGHVAPVAYLKVCVGGGGA